MPAPTPQLHRRGALGLCLGASLSALTLPAAAQSTLPVEVELLLRQAKLPKEAFAAVVQDVGSGRSRLALNANAAMNPASLEKLLTTQAALDLLGPAFSWSTPVWIDGTLKEGVLDGRVIVKGSGDPKLVAERLWLLLQRLRQSGITTILGDFVIDQSAFDIAEVAPGQFDKEPLRAYNVRPQPLLLAQKSLVFTFTPQPERGIATLSVSPPIGNLDTTVPLAANEPCGDWRARLAPQWSEGTAQLQFTGALPVSCGEKTWAMAHAEPALYHPRVIQAMWRELGGTLEGGVRESRERIAPKGTAPSFEFVSPPLAEVVRDINKFSNNTMAQQLFLTLSLQRRGVGTWAGSREVLRQWLVEQVKTSAAGLVVDNGSGLSRESRLSAGLLARVLQHAWRGPTMPDLMASLPASGIDGTMRRSQLPPGRAHLKTGSLRDVAGVAGYVLGSSGKRYVVVAIANHDNAQAARPAIEALVQWVGDDQAF